MNGVGFEILARTPAPQLPPLPAPPIPRGICKGSASTKGLYLAQSTMLRLRQAGQLSR